MRSGSRLSPLAVVLLGGLALAPLVRAQTPPTAAASAPARTRGSDVWVVDLRRDGDRATLARLRRVTDADGYHNQPAFTPDGKAILFTGVTDGAPLGTATDIYRWDIGSRTTTRLTSTAESEYSAAPLPSGVHFTVVRVERDSSQRLWRLNDEGLVVTPVLPRLRKVAYYVWADTARMVLAMLDSAVGGPLSLVVADAGTGAVTPVAKRVGRSIQKIPGRASVSYVQRDSSGTGAWLMELEPYSRRSMRLLRLPDGVEYHAWLPDGALLLGTPRGLAYVRSVGIGATVQPLPLPAGAPTDLAITRVAVSPKGDRVAFVAERK